MRLVDYAVPSGDGELLHDPRVADWPAMVDVIRQAAPTWRFDVCRTSLAVLRDQARHDVLELGRAYTAQLTEQEVAAPDTEAPLIVTGHQPVLFHPGVWVKNLLVDDLARRVGGTALNLIVDNDAIGALCLNVPYLGADGRTAVDFGCLVEGVPDTPYESMAAPTSEALAAWLDPLADRIASLGRPDIASCFERWRGLCDQAAAEGSLGHFFARARRGYERPLATTYLELPVSRLAGTDAFLLFALDLCTRAAAFRGAYDAALAEYRTMREIRNPANPFPDLELDGDFVEMPFWLITDDGRRESLWVGTKPDAIVLNCGSCVAVEVPTDEPGEAVARIRAKGVAVRPKALALTLFARLFFADFFLHGVGGGKYDVVTDELVRDMYGIDPPPYAVASMTLRLPLEGPEGQKKAIADLEQRLYALKHNPDKALEEAGGLDGEASALVARKRELVDAIGKEGADKKALGAEIREVNERLQAFVAPLAEYMQQEIAELAHHARAAEAGQYRDWAYCLFEPGTVREALDTALAGEDG